MNRLTSKVILRTEATNKLGMAPLALRISVNRKTTVLPLYIKIPPEAWRHADSMVLYGKGLQKNEVDQIRDTITRAYDSVNTIRHHYNMIDRLATLDQVREEFLQGKKTNSFIEFCKKHMNHVRNTCEKGTQKSIQNAINKFSRFAPKVTFHELDVKLIARFDAFLKKNYVLSPATIWKHHKDIKMLINASISNGSGIKNPYEQFKVSRPTGTRDFLNREELEKFIKLYDSNTLKPDDQEILRCFLFSCKTGLRISDILKIEYNDIVEDQLVFVPHKTRKAGRHIRVPLSEGAKKFINLTGEGLIFKTLAPVNINRHLKTLAMLAGITKTITFHVARHTFAVTFLESGGMLQVLQKLMGHGKIETTMVYVHVINSDLRDQIKLMDAV